MKKIGVYEYSSYKQPKNSKKAAHHKTVSLDECAEPTSEDEDIERNYIIKERDIALHRAMLKLKPEYRAVLWLFCNTKIPEYTYVSDLTFYIKRSDAERPDMPAIEMPVPCDE